MDDEILELQRQLAAVQMQDTAHRISERNCVELILKLRDMNLIDIIFTKTGKEYVTPAQLKKEIEDEIKAQGGRLSIVDLPPILNVDMNYVEERCQNLIQSNKSMTFLDGQIITDYYLDGIIEEVNESLQDTGQASLQSLAQKYSLPAQFMRAAIEERLGSAIQGHLQGDQLYTEGFVQRHRARIRGAMAGITRPTVLSRVMADHGFLESILLGEAQELTTSHALAGTVKGNTTRATYLPDIFTRTQESNVASFYEQNGYMEFDSLERLQIPNPVAYMEKRYPNGLKLSGVWLGEDYVSSVVSALEDAVTNGNFAVIAPLLPSPLTDKDVTSVLQRCMLHVQQKLAPATGKGQKDSAPLLLQMADVFAVSQTLLVNLANDLGSKCKELGTTRVEAAVAKARAQAEAVALAASGDTNHTAKKGKQKPSDTTSDDEESKQAKPTARMPKPKRGKQEEEEDADAEEDQPDEEEEQKPAKKVGKKAADRPETPVKERKGRKGRKARRGADDSDDDAAASSKSSKGKRAKDIDEDEDVEAEEAGTGSADTGGTRKQQQRKQKKEREAMVAAKQQQKLDKAGPVTAAALSLTDVRKLIDTRLEEDNCPPQLAQALATNLLPKLALSYGEAQKAAWTAAASQSNPADADDSNSVTWDAAERRKRRDLLVTALQELYEHFQIFRNTTRTLEQEPNEAEEEGDDDDDSQPKLSLSTLIADLDKHLLKTIGSRLVDVLLKLEALQNECPFAPEFLQVSSEEKSDASNEESAEPDLKNSLSIKHREDILAFLPAPTSKAFKRLLQSVSQDMDPFLTELDAVSQKSEVLLRKVDKKKERTLVFNLRKGLTTQLEKESDPKLVLHQSVLIIHSQLTGGLFHAPAKAIPGILRSLHGRITEESYSVLNDLNARLRKTDATEIGVDMVDHIRRLGLNPRDATSKQTTKSK